MNKYKYLDTSKGKFEGQEFIAPIILEVTADNIVEADKIFEKEKGKNPKVLPFVSCKIEKLTN